MTDLDAIEFNCGPDRYWARTEYDRSTARWIVRIFDDNSAVVTGYEAFVEHQEVHDLTGTDDNAEAVDAAARGLIREFQQAGGQPRSNPTD
ncbi:MAG TPA: hypothetical protein DEB60_01385 [Brevundimonas sp.]|nr:hypothetical protein [Brevundimonas sp.]